MPFFWRHVETSVPKCPQKQSQSINIYMNSAKRTAKNSLSREQSSQHFSNNSQYPNKLQVTNIKHAQQDLLAPQQCKTFVEKCFREGTGSGIQKYMIFNQLSNDYINVAQSSTSIFQLSDMVDLVFIYMVCPSICMA